MLCLLTLSLLFHLFFLLHRLLFQFFTRPSPSSPSLFPFPTASLFFFFRFTQKKSPFHTLSLSHGLWFIALFFTLFYGLWLLFSVAPLRSRLLEFILLFFPLFQAVPLPSLYFRFGFLAGWGYFFSFHFLFIFLMFMAALLRLLACSKIFILRCLCLALVPFFL